MSKSVRYQKDDLHQSRLDLPGFITGHSAAAYPKHRAETAKSNGQFTLNILAPASLTKNAR
jgi:hypothetical protein